MTLRYTLSLALLIVSSAGASMADSPSDKEVAEEGWITLLGEDGTAEFESIGKKVVMCGDVELAEKPRNLKPTEGKGVLASGTVGNGTRAPNLVTKQKFGDCEIYLEFLMGKGANSGVKLQHRYEIQLYDSHGKENYTAKDCGGIYPHWKWRRPGGGGGLNYIDEGYPAAENVSKPAGEWQTLHIIFRAPKFNNDGKKIENARMVKVVQNGTVIHEDVELDSPTGNMSNPLPEVAEAPVMLQLDHGAVAFRNVRIKPLVD